MRNIETVLLNKPLVFYLMLVLHFLQFVSKVFKRWAIIRIFSPAVLHNLITVKKRARLEISDKTISNQSFDEGLQLLGRCKCITFTKIMM